MEGVDVDKQALGEGWGEEVGDERGAREAEDARQERDLERFG